MFEKLKQWRDDRHISGFNHETQVRNIAEELFEFMSPVSGVVKANTDEFMYKYYADLTDDNDKIDSLCDIIVFATNAIELMGYDAKECMDETIKEISSRKQNPIQKYNWETKGYDGTKWMKDQHQDKDTLYKANYTKCKKD